MVKFHYLWIIIVNVLITGCFTTHKNLKASTQTLVFERYLDKIVPDPMNFQATIDENNGLCSKVCINYQNSKDLVFITTLEDYYSKDCKSGVKKTVFRETPERAYYISDFEAVQISKGCKIIVKLLEEFDECIKNRKMDKLQGLDSYLIRFLKGFNFLICSATNNTVFLFSSELNLDSLYDISVDIGKLNARVNRWSTCVESRSKLQTVTKELLFQCRIWDKKLQQINSNHEILINDSLIKAMNIFMHIYIG